MGRFFFVTIAFGLVALQAAEATLTVFSKRDAAAHVIQATELTKLLSAPPLLGTDLSQMTVGEKSGTFTVNMKFIENVPEGLPKAPLVCTLTGVALVERVTKRNGIIGNRLSVPSLSAPACE